MNIFNLQKLNNDSHINISPAPNISPSVGRCASVGILSFIMALTIIGCDKPTTDARNPTPTAPHIEKINIGPVEVTITLTPGSVMLDRDVLLSIRTTAPKNITVAIPPIANRLQGFIDSSSFDREPTVTDSHKTTERVIKLTPLISDEYRIAPMAITYGRLASRPSPSSQAPVPSPQSPTPPTWGATPPIALPLHSITENKIGNDISTKLSHIWIHPSLRTVAGYITIIIILIIIITIAIKLFGRIQRKVRLMRMSPCERALEELKELLNKKLIEKHLLKDFYVELTMVVRRYIERQHHVRAPEQTTEEFLGAISSNSEFTPDVIKRLKEFLQEADLVKFAAYTPNQNSNNNAIETAKSYITTDSSAGDSNVAPPPLSSPSTSNHQPSTFS